MKYNTIIRLYRELTSSGMQTAKAVTLISYAFGLDRESTQHLIDEVLRD
jgi:hypothetical protein